MTKRLKIAIAGTGISANGAAYRLAPHHDITVFEKQTRIGGHSNTVEVDYDGVRIPVDTGFIVYNELNYPKLTALFAELGVETQESDMSFGVSTMNGRFEWSGRTVDSVFSQRSNLFSPGFLFMLREIFRFNRLAREDLSKGLDGGLSLGAYLEARGFSSRFRRDYLLPMGAAIWSTPASEMLRFPARSFLDFFRNHRLIDDDRPVWRTVTGGSRAYVEKLTAPFAGPDPPRGRHQACHAPVRRRAGDGHPRHDRAVRPGRARRPLGRNPCNAGRCNPRGTAASERHPL